MHEDLECVRFGVKSLLLVVSLDLETRDLKRTPWLTAGVYLPMVVSATMVLLVITFVSPV